MSAAARKPEVVRISTIDDIVAAVPHVLGFRPSDSLVATALCGPRERLSFTMRVDLVEEEHDGRVAAYVASCMQRAGADAMFVFVYTDAPVSDGSLPREALVREVARLAPVPLRDAVLVADGRVWSYICDDHDCCPVEGRSVDATSSGAVALAAAHALHGRAVLPDREAVVASVAPADGIAAKAQEQAIERAAEELLAIGMPAFLDRVRTELDELLTRYDDPPAALTGDEAARVVVALHDVPFRDEVLRRLVVDGEALRLLLHDLARRAIPPLDAPACTCLAWAAYTDGDGLVAAAALERALASDPGYRMATLLADALRGQTHPETLRRALTADRADTRRQPPGRSRGRR